jgi:hypothetical protein
MCRRGGHDSDAHLMPKMIFGLHEIPGDVCAASVIQFLIHKEW